MRIIYTITKYRQLKIYFSSLQLKVKPDVAGAIFIGACTSLLDLLFRIYGASVSTPDIKGFGIFVGPSVFAILILVAVGGFATKEALR